MLTSEEILKRVFSGKVSFINEPIDIQYDNRINLPIDFYFEEEHYEILEVINLYKRILSSTYLLRTDKDIFSVTSYIFKIPFTKIILYRFWSLDFKVIE